MPATGLDILMLHTGLVQGLMESTRALEGAVVRPDANPEQFQPAVGRLGVTQHPRVPGLKISWLP